MSSEDKRAAAAAFYQQIGLFAKQKGIVISVISIQGTECRIENLGQLADLTGGRVRRNLKCISPMTEIPPRLTSSTRSTSRKTSVACSRIPYYFTPAHPHVNPAIHAFFLLSRCWSPTPS